MPGDTNNARGPDNQDSSDGSNGRLARAAAVLLSRVVEDCEWRGYDPNNGERCCPTCEEWAYQGKGEGREHGYACGLDVAIREVRAALATRAAPVVAHRQRPQPARRRAPRLPARGRRAEGAARCKESFGRPTSVRCELRGGHRGKHEAFAASAIFIGRIRWATGSKSAEVVHGG